MANQEERLEYLKNRFLNEILQCETKDAVEAAVSFAGYLNFIGLDSDNYPVFLKMLDIQNHWVVDALIGEDDPVDFLSEVQPNYRIVQNCFVLLTRHKPNGIYPKLLLMVLGLLKKVYLQALEGYKLYLPSISDSNNLGKHLDETEGQDNPVNRIILDILSNFSELTNYENDPKIDEISRQAGRIRTNFLDSKRSLKSAIPEVLLEKGDYRIEEVNPEFIYL